MKKFSSFRFLIFAVISYFAISTSAIAQTSTISSAAQINIGGFEKGKTQQILSQFQIVQAVSTVTLSSIAVVMGGTYQTGDIATNGFKLYGGTTNDINIATLLKSVSTASGTGETITFGSMTYSLTVATHFFWITVDVNSSATTGRTINAGSIANTAFAISAGTKSGSVPLGGTCTIIPVNAPFTPGNLVALVAANNGSSNTTGTIIEVNTSSAAQTPTIIRNVGAVTGSTAARIGGSSTATGYLSNSNDGTLVAFDLALGTTSAAAAANTITGRGAITYNNIGTASSFGSTPTYTGTSAQTPRSATTINNTNYFFGESNGLFTNGASAATVSGSFRAIKAFGGVAYGCVSSITNALGTFSSPTATTFSVLPGFGSVTTAPLDFYFLSSGSNGTTYDVCYLTTALGISKYSLVSGTWTANGTYAYGAAFGIAASWNGSGSYLYITSGTGATSANLIVRITDAAGYNTSINVTPANNVTLYTAPTGANIKGIAFSPLRGPISTGGVTVLSGFTYTEGSGPSAEQSFTVSGTNLSNNIVITPPISGNYQISTGTAGTFVPTNPITLTQSGGNVSATTIYVRLKSALLNANSPFNNEVISIASTQALTQNINLNGSVASPTPSITSTYPVSLTGFLGVNPAASNVQTYTISAANLTSALTINASSPYEISTPSVNGGAYASGLNLGTSITNVVISIRIAAGTATGTYSSGTITTSSSDAGVNNLTIVNMSGQVYSGTFSTGFLSVETIGDGVASLSGTANYISIREYNTTGAQTNVFTMPGATTSLPSSSPWYMVESGSATSAGQMNRSTDGSQLIFPGYNALVGTATLTLTTTPTNKRVMGVVYPNGTNSNYANDFFSASGATTGIFRSIASNGYSYWAVGTSPVSAGLFYLKDAYSTPVSLGSINTRVARIFNNILYYSTATTSNAGIFQVSTNGLPLSVSDVAIVRLTDATYANTVTNGSSPYAFEINPAGNIMYIADDGAFSSSAIQKGGVVKYTKSGSTWTFQYTLPSPANSARGLAVDWSTANPTLYFTTTASSNNAIAKLIDVNSSSTGTIITAGAGTNYVFRGIQFSPVTIVGAQLTCTANLLPFGGQPVGISSLEKAFNVAGTGFTGNITVSIPVTAPTDQYGLSLTPGGPYTSSVTLSGGSPANATVYMVLNPNAVGTYNGNLTISATGASNLLVPVTGKGIIPVNYYNVSGADVTRLVNWGTNINGTGTNPPDFTSDGQYFNINNTPLALASSATTAAIDQLATTASGSATLTFTGVPTCNNSPQSLFVGATITGTGIPGGTTILNITANTITMSANATVTDNLGTTISVAVTGPWTITGSLSKIVVGNGINFIIPSTRAYSGTADVGAGGTLTLQNNTLPTLGALDVASTVNYNQTGAATVVTATYGNLTLQGSALDSRTLPSSSSIALDLKVLGSFVANNVTVSAATVSPFTYMELGKDFTMSNGAVMLAAAPTTSLGLLYIVTTGNSNQTFSYTGGGVIRINNLSSTKSAGTITLGSNTTLLAYTSPGIGLTFSGSAAFVSQSGTNLNTTGSASVNLNFSGSATFTLGGSLNTDDNTSASLAAPVTPIGSLIANFPTGTTFTDGGNIITVANNLGMGGATASYNLTGTVVVATQSGSSTLGDNALNATIVPTLKNFTFAPIGGTGTTFAGSNGTVNIAGNFLISSAGTATTNKISGGSNTINIGGNFTDQRTIDMVSPGTATWTFNGSSAQTFSTAYASGESFYSVELTNSAGLTMTSGNINIGASGNITCTSGIVTTGSNKVLLNATAFVVESVSSYILGNVQTTRTLNTFAEAFGGIGLSISAGTAPGATTVLRNTGTSNAIGCVNKSVKRTFTITNSGSALNANLAFTFVPANELNGLVQTDLDLYDVVANTPFANSTINTNTITKTGLATIAGTYSASITAPTITGSAVADTVCFSTGSQNSDLTYSASTGDITTYSITWSGAAPGQGFTNVTNAAIVASPISITVPANAVAGTYSGSLTVKNSSGCTSASSPFTLRINPLLTPSVTIALKTGNNPTCDGGTVVMKATPTNGGTGVTYEWYKNGSITPVSGNSTDTLLITNITSTTTVYVKMIVGSGICVNAPNANSTTTTINTIANSWTGFVSNNWFDKKNWCANAVPTSSTDVFIPVTSRNPVITGSVNAVVDNLNIASGVSISITNVTLNVTRGVTGTGTISGNGGLTFAFNANIGTLYFGAGGIKTLRFTGAGGSATLGNATSVYGELNVGSATLNTGGNLTLKSDINGTAWVAPITGGSVTGNVTVERYIPQNSFRAWRMLSVPVQGSQTFKQSWQENQAPLANGNPGYGTIVTSSAGGNGYDAASGNSLLSFANGNPGTFTAVSNTNNAMATTSGYFLFIRGNRSTGIQAGVFNPTATTLRTNGTLYTGTQAAITLPAGQNVMVGNVYAAPIDFNVMMKSGISAFKVWDPKFAGTSNAGGYQTFSSTNGYVAVPGGGSYGNTPNSRIESGAAFIVSSMSGGSIQLTEAAKVTGSKNVFRPGGIIQQLKTRLYSVGNDGEEVMADGNAVVFNNEFSNELDNEDVVKTNNPAENIGIANGSTNLVIDARKPIVETDVIAFQVTNLKQQLYKLEFIPSNIKADLKAYIEDKYLGTKTEMNLTETSKVIFKVDNNAASSASDRFRIVFASKNTQPAVTIEEETIGTIKILPTLVTGKTFTIQMNNQPRGKYNVNVLNNLGQTVYSGVINTSGGNSTHSILLNSAVLSGVHQVEIKGSNNKRMVEKIVISNK